MAYAQAAAGSVSFSLTPKTAIDYKTHIQAFTSVLLAAGQLIFKATQRCEANWVLLGVDAATIVEDLPGFVPSGITGVRGIRRIGTLNGRWTCYKDPQIGDRNFLVGYKGTSFLETGLIYCPYIPFFMTPLKSATYGCGATLQ